MRWPCCLHRKLWYPGLSYSWQLCQCRPRSGPSLFFSAQILSCSSWLCTSTQVLAQLPIRQHAMPVLRIKADSKLEGLKHAPISARVCPLEARAQGWSKLIISAACEVDGDAGRARRGKSMQQPKSTMH
jgi:hypothetical protein